MLDFLIIYKVVSAYVTWRGRNTGSLQKTLDTCWNLRQGRSVPASLLLGAQSLSMRWWANIAFLVFLPVFALLGLFALIRPDHTGNLIGAALGAIFVTLALAALGQVPVQRYRSIATMRAVYRMLGHAATRPLPPGSRGLPRRRDFWLAALIPNIVGLIYLVLRVRYPTGP